MQETGIYIFIPGHSRKRCVTRHFNYCNAGCDQWKASDLLNFDFNYTYTSTYDGAEQDDPNPNANYYNAQMVRVPRNIFNLATNIKIPEYDNLDLTLKTKWSDVARDYGNGNRTFADERLDDYLVNEL